MDIVVNECEVFKRFRDCVRPRQTTHTFTFVTKEMRAKENVTKETRAKESVTNEEEPFKESVTKEMRAKESVT